MSAAEIARHYSGRRVLVGGGLGFVGSNLARRLEACGAEVTVVDAEVEGSGALRWNLAGIDDRVELHLIDQADSEAMLPIVAGQDYVFNLAGRGGHLDSICDPLGDLRANVESHLGLLEACRRSRSAATVVFTSTRQVYGRCERLPVTEDQAPKPLDVNGCHKLAAEHLHRVYLETHGVPTVTLRLTATFGPRMRVRDARNGFLGAWIRRILEDEPVEVYGDGTQLRDFNHVDDVVDALLAVAAEPSSVGRIYNLGSDTAYSLAELARLLVEVHGSGTVRHVPFPDDLRPIELGSFRSDYGAIRSSLGWVPKISIEEGLRRTLDYYRNHLPSYL